MGFGTFATDAPVLVDRVTPHRVICHRDQPDARAGQAEEGVVDVLSRKTKELPCVAQSPGKINSGRKKNTSLLR
jgi:hypothetical protein